MRYKGVLSQHTLISLAHLVMFVIGKGFFVFGSLTYSEDVSHCHIQPTAH